LKTSTIDIFALKIPNFYVVERTKEDYLIRNITLHDFQKINNDDEIIKNSILNFSFYLTSGNLDEAYKSVKNIQNSAIW
jgi:intraflagellar transport protein 140